MRSQTNKTSPSQNHVHANQANQMGNKFAEWSGRLCNQSKKVEDIISQMLDLFNELADELKQTNVPASQPVRVQKYKEQPATQHNYGPTQPAQKKGPNHQKPIQSRVNTQPTYKPQPQMVYHNNSAWDRIRQDIQKPVQCEPQIVSPQQVPVQEKPYRMMPLVGKQYVTDNLETHNYVLNFMCNKSSEPNNIGITRGEVLSTYGFWNIMMCETVPGQVAILLQAKLWAGCRKIEQGESLYVAFYNGKIIEFITETTFVQLDYFDSKLCAMDFNGDVLWLDEEATLFTLNNPKEVDESTCLSEHFYNNFTLSKVNGQQIYSKMDVANEPVKANFHYVEKAHEYMPNAPDSTKVYIKFIESYGYPPFILGKDGQKKEISEIEFTTAMHMLGEEKCIHVRKEHTYDVTLKK